MSDQRGVGARLKAKHATHIVTIPGEHILQFDNYHGCLQMFIGSTREFLSLQLAQDIDLAESVSTEHKSCVGERCSGVYLHAHMNQSQQIMKSHWSMLISQADQHKLGKAQSFVQLHDQDLLQGKTVVVITSGANMNFDRLRLVSELADIGALREAMLATSIPETPGSFRAFIDTALSDTSQSVTEFKYR